MFSEPCFPSSLLFTLLDFLLEGRSLSSPRWDKRIFRNPGLSGTFSFFQTYLSNLLHAVPETRPNHTIYINNLNEKIKKDELKKSL